MAEIQDSFTLEQTNHEVIAAENEIDTVVTADRPAAPDAGVHEPAVEGTSVVEDSTSASGSTPSSSPSASSSSSTPKRFVVVKNPPESSTQTADESQILPSASSAASGTSIRILTPGQPTLGRTDAPNHIMPMSSERRVPQPSSAPVGTNFFQRLRTTRQVLSTKANEVLTAASPALSKAGHVVRTAANQAAVVASSSSSLDAARSFARENNPYTSGVDASNAVPEDEAVKPSSDVEQHQLPSRLDEVSPSTVANDLGEHDGNATAPVEPSATSDVSSTESPRSKNALSSDSATASFRGRYAPSAPLPPAPAGEKQRGVGAILQHTFGSQHILGHQGSVIGMGGGRPPMARSNSATSLPPHLVPSFPASSSSSAGTQSQTALILQSSAGPHMQSLLSSLEPYEHVMLLGQGLMGVNLKDCYNGGVYVDAVLANGNADKSGVVQVGDIVVKVGEISVRKLSIKEVPSIIAKQIRPTVIVLSRKHMYPDKDVERLSPMDCALSTVIDIQNRVKEERERSIASMPFTGTDGSGSPEYRRTVSSVSITTDSVVSSSSSDDDGSVETSSDADSTGANTSILSTTTESSFGRTVGTKPRRGSPAPSKAVQRSLAAYDTRRQIEMSFYSAIKRAHVSDETFCNNMKLGFQAVCGDARCLPFLAAHLTKESMYDSRPATPVGASQSTPPSTWSVKLMLWLETHSYHELWAVTPPQRRLNHALRVAQKFLMATPAVNGDTSAGAPMFDLRNEIPDEIFERVAQALQTATDNPSTESVPREIFAEVQGHIEQSFCGIHFASFIMGESFARMRAYISGSPVYTDVPLEELWKDLMEENSDAQNYMHYIMVHLFSSDINRGAGLAASLFIARKVLKALDGACADKVESEAMETLLGAFQHLWNVYLSPVGGTLDVLSMSKEATDALVNARERVSSVSLCHDANEQYLLLTNEELKQSLRVLAEELNYEYASNFYPRFKMDRLHDLLFREVISVEEKSKDMAKSSPPLAQGCISRLLRTAKLPQSVSSHRPHRLAVPPEPESVAELLASEEPSENCNAEFAVVFGTDMGARPSLDQTIRRFCAVQVGPLQPLEVGDGASRPPRVLCVEELPATLEGYAAIDPGRFIKRPMGNHHRVCISDDGWEVYLLNFTVPHTSADHPNNCLYGVSLVLHRSSPPEPGANEDSDVESLPAQGISDDPDNLFQAIAVEGAERYLTFDIVHKVDQIFKEAPSPAARRLRQEPWSKQFCEGGNTVGVSLIANRNVIPAMRQSLSDFFKGSSSGHEPKDARVVVAGLADILGGFSHRDGIQTSLDLQSILIPYLESGSRIWEHLPVPDQAAFFEKHSVRQLLSCLSPSAFWLAFLAVLLEQKTVFISSRRSILLSAVTALSKLVAPLEWPHLMVPIVPANLAGDLIHYPAPFLVGMCSQEKENQEVLQSLPKDVTLIDLDLGRVILGAEYASSNDSKIASDELRLQVFYLSEELGAYFGSKISPGIWRCEDPSCLLDDEKNESANKDLNVYETVREMCQEFIAELTAGTNSCCTWIEECNGNADTKQESIVLFDEDRFFHLKNLRSKKMYSPLLKDESDCSSRSVDGSLRPVGKFAVGLDDFDLILETFLRGQAMSAFVSSRPKETMVYW